MNLTSVVKEGKVVDRNFPKLMKGKQTGKIYLMQNKSTGVALSQGNNLGSIGKYSDKHEIQHLQDFYGSVTITSGVNK